MTVGTSIEAAIAEWLADLVEPHRQDVQRHIQVVGLLITNQAEILTGWIGLASGCLRFLLVWQPV